VVPSGLGLAGFYEVTLAVRFTAGADGSGVVQTQIRQNAAGSDTGGNQVAIANGAGIGDPESVEVVKRLQLAEGDYLEAFAQSTVTDRNADGASNATYFEMHFIGLAL